MGAYPTGPKSCSADPNCTPRITSVASPGVIIIFCWWGLVMLSCAAYLITKALRQWRSPVPRLLLNRSMAWATPESSVSGEKGQLLDSPPKAGRSLNGSSTDPKDVESMGIEDTRLELERELGLLYFTPYREDPAGRFCYIICVLTSAHWIALYVVILWDFYNKCEVGGIDNLCFFGNHFIFGDYLNNGQVFFVVWVLSAIWFTVWLSNKGNVVNWFRMPCDLDAATIVHVWALEEAQIMSTYVSPVVLMLRRVKRRLVSPDKQGHGITVPVRVTAAGQRFLLFQGTRFLVEDRGLQRAELKVGQEYIDFHLAAKGLFSVEAQRRRDIVGDNVIPFKVDNLGELLYHEFFSFFYNYQLIMYILWFWSSYLFIASMLACVVFLSAALSIYMTHKAQVAISTVTSYVTKVMVLRDGKWAEVDSPEVVPGDVVKVHGDWDLPCDLLLIQGSCVCNESALTGEAMPIQKLQAPNEAKTYDPAHAGARHTLFAGTTVLQAGTTASEEVLAVVTATGMATSKGDLLAAILFPKTMLFKYDEELPVVVLLLVVYAAICAVLAIVFQVVGGQQSVWVTKWIYMVFIVSQILSPMLPVALTMGFMNAMQRLKTKGINCLNPKRIAISGKIRVFCFDKTGTLTKDGLDFLGAQPVINKAFGAVTGVTEASLPHWVLNGIATCHAVSKFGDSFVGNQVEVKMFTATGWTMLEEAGQSPTVQDNKGFELKVVQRNEFDHATMTMSVVVLDPDGEYHVFCKGSFEKIGDISKKESLPDDYMACAKGHALDGCYVLALAHRSLGKGIRAEKIAALSRKQLEQDLDFISLILFRNELKPDTREAILALKEGEVRPVMVTGDNAHCGYYIAKACGMVAPDTRVLLADVDQYGGVVWTQLGDDSSKGVRTSEVLTQHEHDLNAGRMELALTGKAYRILKKTDLAERLLFYTRINARFTPEEKVEVIAMHTARGLVVGMCGDGGNDCGALRAAHAGIALSEAEASVVSPFTSKSKSVASVVDLLREGRGALHTCFGSFKFLIMYGLLFSVLKLCSYWYGVIVSQMMYIMIDGVGVILLGYTITQSRPSSALGKARPTSSLLGPLNVSSILGAFSVNLCFLVGALFLMQTDPNYVRWPAKYALGASWWTLGDNSESTVLFFTIYFQFITGSFIFSFGSTFRQPVWRNYGLMVVYIGLMVFVSCILLLPSSGLTQLFHIASYPFNAPGTASPVWQMYQDKGGLPSPAMSFNFRLRLWLLQMGNVAALIIWQKVVAEGWVSQRMRKRFPSKRPQFNL